MSLIKLAGGFIKDNAALVRDFVKYDLKNLPKKISQSVEDNPVKYIAGSTLLGAGYLAHKLKDKK